MAAPHPKINGAPAMPGRYGFGTTEAVDTLLRYLRTVDKSMSVVVAINVDTLIRNAVGDKSVSSDSVVRDVRRCMNEIATEISGVCNDRWTALRHNVIYYMFNSDAIVPVEFRRPRNLGTIEDPTTWRIIEAAMRKFRIVAVPGAQTVGNCTAHLVMNEHFMKPTYKGIQDIVNSVSTSENALHLISHVPMDYHVVLGTGREGVLYRSHTGEAIPITPSTMGRVVFKSDFVPFYPKTHVLLGDKYCLKSPLTPTDKKRLIALAEKDKWVMHTNTFVGVRLKENNFVLPYSLD